MMVDVVGSRYSSRTAAAAAAAAGPTAAAAAAGPTRLVRQVRAVAGSETDVAGVVLAVLCCVVWSNWVLLEPLTPGPHRNRQALFRPCLRPSERAPARSVPSRPPPAAAGGGFDGTERAGPGRAQTVANRAGTALTGAVRTGR